MAHTIYLCRHGDTDWSPTRRLAGRTDIELSAIGEHNARQVGARLRDVAFDRVYCSPLLRARRTAELAGYGDRATYDGRLMEMAFGDYEGSSVQVIRETRPGWTYLVDGNPGGEDAAQVGARVDAFLAELAAPSGTTLVIAHSIVTRVLTARYLGLPPQAGRHLMMSPGAISVLGYDVVDDAPAIVSWNDRAHLVGQAAPG